MVDFSTGGLPTHFGFLLLPDFTHIALASAVEPLRMANRICGKNHYSWTILSEEGEAVSASDGLSIDVDYGIGNKDVLKQLDTYETLLMHCYNDEGSYTGGGCCSTNQGFASSNDVGQVTQRPLRYKTPSSAGKYSIPRARGSVHAAKVPRRPACVSYLWRTAENE